jgi:hypothetical protein
MYREEDIRRGFEIKELYFIVLKKAIRDGIPEKEAKDRANYAVELLYNISPRSRKNIVYKYSSERKKRRGRGEINGEDDLCKSLFIEKIYQLLCLLKEVRDEIE